jgi:protein TonB
MHTFETVSGLSGKRKSGKFVSVALVGSLHVAAIYTLLVALDIVPNPVKPMPPIDIHIIRQEPKKTTPPPLTDKVVLTHPSELPPPPTPFFKWALPESPTAPTPTPPQPQPQGSQGPVVSPAPGPTLPLQPMSGTHTIPPYPMLGIRMGHEGTARLRLTVDQQGNVLSAEILQSSGHDELDAAALAWVKAHWRYRPAMKDGKPVGATTQAVVTFRLDMAHG